MATNKTLKFKNPVRYLSEKIDDSMDSEGNGVILTGVIGGLVLSVGAAAFVENSFYVENDNTGTVKEQSELVSAFKARISELKQQKIELEKAKAELQVEEKFSTLTEEQKEALGELKASFVDAKKSVLTDLYTEGFDDSGAGLSEENFQKLYNEVTSFLDVDNGKIVDTDFYKNIRTGVLDESISRIVEKDVVTNEEDLALKINKEMADSYQTEEIVRLITTMGIFFGGGISTIALLLFMGAHREKFPEEIKVNIGRKNLPSNH